MKVHINGKANLNIVRIVSDPFDVMSLLHYCWFEQDGIAVDFVMTPAPPKAP